MLTFLMIGAHPDDMDLRASGLAMKLMEKGHRVVFLSATSGNAGHMSMDKEELRLRRRGEMENAGSVFGVPYETLDIDDGYLTADIPTREKLMRFIRRVRPDVIVTHRSCDYHPDHRACGQLVCDCSYLVGVPLFCPDVPAMRRAPVILFSEDRFTTPAPFRADVAVSCDPWVERKIRGTLQHESQFYEWLPYDRNWTEVLKSKSRAEARAALEDLLRKRFAGPVTRFPDRFPAGTRYGEVFQTDEYGGAMTEEIRSVLEA
jgi:LmbE family N-acetylglucosaminyl deacetylase